MILAMMTIRSLLDRIRWDRNYGGGRFVIGYYDRIEERIILVPFEAVEADPDNRSILLLSDAKGQSHSVPLHRVYEVYRNGELIWERKRRER